MNIREVQTQVDIKTDHFRPIPFQRGRLRWNLPGNNPDQNLELGIRNMQMLFLKSFPEFESKFLLIGSEKVPVNLRDEARDFISQRVQTSRNFRAVFGQSPIKPHHAPYFKRSPRLAITLAFEPWGISFEQLPRVGKDSKYKDSEGKSFVTASSFRSGEYKIPYKPLIKILQTVPSIQGLTMIGMETTLYDEEAVKQKIKEHYGVPKVDRRTGVYENEAGEELTDAYSLSKKFGMSTTWVSKTVRKLTYIEGKDSMGRTVRLYKIQDFLDLAQPDFSSPPVNRKQTHQVDVQGRIWISTTELWRRYGVTSHTAATVLKDIPSKEARNTGGIKVMLYDMEEAIKKFDQFQRLPRCDRETGIFTDEDNNEWAPKYLLQKKINMTAKAFGDFVKKVEVHILEGRDRLGKRVTLYRLSDFLDKVNLANSKIEVAVPGARSELARLLEVDNG